MQPSAYAGNGQVRGVSGPDVALFVESRAGGTASAQRPPSARSAETTVSDKEDRPGECPRARRGG
jgi:hypothetical protein